MYESNKTNNKSGKNKLLASATRAGEIVKKVEDVIFSDYAASEDLQSMCGSDDEEGSHGFPEFNANIDMRDPQFLCGMTFRLKEELKKAVKIYSIKNQYDNIWFRKTDKG